MTILMIHACVSKSLSCINISSKVSVYWIYTGGRTFFNDMNVIFLKFMPQMKMTCEISTINNQNFNWNSHCPSLFSWKWIFHITVSGIAMSCDLFWRELWFFPVRPGVWNRCLAEPLALLTLTEFAFSQLYF